jgi:hypothetical protein
MRVWIGTASYAISSDHKMITRKYEQGITYQIHVGGVRIAEPVMGPVVTILIGALLIAIGVTSASSLVPGVGIVLGIGGVATVLVGIIMLFGLAQEKK